MARRQLPNKLEMIKEAWELYQAGTQIQFIAARLGVAHSCISRWLRDPKGNIAKEEAKRELENKIRELSDQGLTHKEIGKITGASTGKVQSTLTSQERREANSAARRKRYEENRDKELNQVHAHQQKLREEQLNDYRQGRSKGTGKARIPYKLRDQFIEKALEMGVVDWTPYDITTVVWAIEEVLEEYPAFLPLYGRVCEYAYSLSKQMRKGIKEF